MTDTEVGVIRIATWNVAYARGPRNDHRRALMESVDADVWVLTETHDDLSPGPAHRPVHAAQRPEGANAVVDGSRWVSIWTRLPILEGHVQTVDPERSVACIVDTHGQRLLIYGTVLPWHSDEMRGGMLAELAIQGPDWSTLPAENRALCCVAGDFNVNLGGPHYYGSKAGKAGVAAMLAAAGLVPVTDFERTKEVSTADGIIDHIAVTASVAGTSTIHRIWGQHDTEGNRLSDHSGISVNIAV